MDPGVLVVGVDLDAQVVLGVDDLDEQGEGIPLYAAEELGARFPQASRPRIPGRIQGSPRWDGR